MADDTEAMKDNKNRLNLSLDYKVIALMLLAVILAMLAMWRPWTTSASSDDRTISVTGEAKVTAEPDEYAFYPNYEFRGPDKNAALNEMTKKSEELVAKLKGLGVEDNKIKTHSNGYDGIPYPVDGNTKEVTYNLSLNIRVGQREMAQKVQDYLVTTSPTGSVSPQATFSDNKKKELEREARDKATREARAKADQSAKNLGFRVGGVKSVEDGTGFGAYPMPERGVSKVTPALDSSSGQLNVQPGENELHYSVTVVYFLR